MHKKSLELARQERQFTYSSFWRTLRRIPVTIILLVFAYLLVMMLKGGMTKVLAWYQLQEIPPPQA